MQFLKIALAAESFLNSPISFVERNENNRHTSLIYFSVYAEKIAASNNYGAKHTNGMEYCNAEKICEIYLVRLCRFV